MKSKNKDLLPVLSTSSQDQWNEYLEFLASPNQYMINNWVVTERTTVYLISTVAAVPRTGMAFGFIAYIKNFKYR